VSRIYALILRELRTQVYSPMAWIIWTLFLFLAGWFFFSLVVQFEVLVENTATYAAMMQSREMMDRLNLNEMVVQGLFGNFVILYVFLIPVLTMRSFAEERRQGTDELLLTAPVTPGQVVAGKYVGQLVIASVLVAAAAFYVAVLLRYGDPERGPIVTGLLGLGLVVGALTALHRHEEPDRRRRLLVRSVPGPVRGRLAGGIHRGSSPGCAEGAVAPRAFRRVRQGDGLQRRRGLLRLARGPGAVRRASRHRVAKVPLAVREALRIAGYAGTVLLLFGLMSFAFSGTFDGWTAVHIAGGSVCILAALASNFSDVLRAVAARGTRERAKAVSGALVFAALLVALNVLAARFPKTWDATESKIYTLSDRSVAILEHLDREVELVAFLGAGDRNRDAIEETLSRYAARSRRVTYRVVDPDKEPQEADRFGVTRSGVLAARCGETTAIADGDPGGAIGEGDITALILKVTRSRGQRVYVLTGHGEPEIGDLETPQGLGSLSAALKEDTIELRPLFLAAAETVPEDADAVVLCGPVKPLIPHERDQLRAYLARGGRLLAMVDPGIDAGIAPLLTDYRLLLNDDMIVDQEEMAFLGARLGLDPIVEEFPPHPITRGFRQRIRLSQARSITIEVEGGLPGVVARPVARTRASSWGEARWKETLASGRVARDGGDAAGPLLVMATATAKVEPSGETRIVLVGDSDWVRNGNFDAFFNRELVVNAMHWLTGSEDLIVGPQRTLRVSRLDMTTADQRNLFRFGVLLMPEVLLIGGIVAWLRRKAL
jgi:ABC-type uncharacterized transport system involved in gliding motility auxiliary subunit